MEVRELKCTGCFAPIDLSRGSVTRCHYCGTTLVVEGRAPPVMRAPAAPIDFAKSKSLTLVDAGKNLISVIKAIRMGTGLGLRETKDLAESVPCVVATSIDWGKIDAFRRALDEAGATTSTAMVE